MEASVSLFDSVIIRLSGELGIKKHWTRKFYTKKLVRNIKSTVQHHTIPYREIVRKNNRLFLRTGSAVKAANKLAQIFGISSTSPSLETSPELSDVVNCGLNLAHQLLAVDNRFAVRCQRVGKQPYTSIDVCRVLGKRILEELGDTLGLKVDLGRPDVTIGVEVRNAQAFVYSDTIGGVGGMPLGSQRPVVGLLSGGTDSPVACWMMMKRGCPVVPVYFDNTPYTDKASLENTLNVGNVLFDWALGFPKNIYVIPHGENLKKIMETRYLKFTCLLCKRLMYRISEHLAELVGAEGIVTGESIGQHASQTIVNLRVLNDAIKKYPIHRPLLGFDKTEIEKVARKIGTYTISSRKAGKCLAAPRKPSTKAKLVDVLRAEEEIGISRMVERSIKSYRVVNL